MYGVMSRRRLLLPVLLAGLVTAPAHAAEVTIGSDLAAPATVAFSDGNDWAAWNTTLASGGEVTSPVTGEVNVVKLKGSLLPDRNDPTFVPDVVMHVMVLRPQDDGTVKTVSGGVSRDLPLPFGGDPQRINTYTRAELDRPDGADGKGGSRVCIQKGDILSFTTSGGFGGFAKDNPKQVYTNGAPFQVFASGVRSVISDHLMGGAYPEEGTIRGIKTGQGGRELLMQATVGTRENARYTCRTDAEKKENLDYVKPVVPTPTTTVKDPYGVPTQIPVNGVATLIKPKKAPKVRNKKVSIPVQCSAAGACAGRLGLRNYSGNKAFSMTAGQKGVVTLKLNTRAAKKLKRKGARLTVKATLTNAAGAKSVMRFLIKRA